MITLLEKAMELGKNGEYKKGGVGTDTNNNGIPEYDCSGLITAAMKELGYDIKGRLSTSSIIDNSKGLFEPIPTNQLQIGDILILNVPGGGLHAVIVEKYENNTWWFYGANSSDSGIGSQKFGPDTHWNKGFKVFRPKPCSQPSLPTKSKVADTTTRRDPLFRH